MKGFKIRFSVWVLGLTSLFMVGLPHAEATSAKTNTKATVKKVAATKPAAKTQTVAAAKPGPNPAKATAAPTATRAPAAIDPNRALEVRGQSRTLSMMLVLKNGKESINFIKVRKDYSPEIAGTQY